MQNQPLKVDIWRSDSNGTFDAFEVPRLKQQTVLDVVTYIQRELDNTLSYRYSCRVGMCGTCAMNVNGVPPVDLSYSGVLFRFSGSDQD